MDPANSFHVVTFGAEKSPHAPIMEQQRLANSYPVWWGLRRRFPLPIVSFSPIVFHVDMLESYLFTHPFLWMLL